MKDKIKKRTRLNKGARTYLASTQKAFSHPVRRDILKTLKKGTCSSVDLEEIIGTTRYNLYHHLDVLIKEDVRLVVMSSLASGQLNPIEAYEYIGGLPNVEAITFGASSKEHIRQNINAINSTSLW